MRWNGAFLIFAKRKNFFCFLQNIDIQVFRSNPRARAFHIWKKNFSSHSKNFFSKKFWRMKKRFYNAVYSKAKQDGQQVRKKRIKKQVKTKQQKETDKPIRKSEKQRAFFVGNLFSWLGQTKIRPFVLERLKRVSNNHTARDYKPM